MPKGCDLTVEDFKNRFRKFNPSFKLVSKYPLRASRRAVTIQCIDCKHTMIRSGVFSRSVQCENCNACSGIAVTHERFLSRMMVNAPRLRALSRYVNTSTNISVRCLDCRHTFEVSPQPLMYGFRHQKTSNCPACAKHKLRISPEDYLRRLSKKRPDVKLLDAYQGTGIRLRYKSLICGHEFTSNPDNVLNGSRAKNGCETCASKKGSLKGNHEDFVQTLSRVHPHLRLLETYGGLTKFRRFKCLLDSAEFMAQPHRVLCAVYGCIECARREGGYSFKEVVVKGRKFRLQGYEPYFVKLLATNTKLFKELRYGKDVPRFRYRDTSPTTNRFIDRTYRPDFYIPSKSLIIEIKSTQTAAGKPEWFRTLKRKRQSVLDGGYKFCLIVFNDKGERLRVAKNWHRRTLTASSIVNNGF